MTTPRQKRLRIGVVAILVTVCVLAWSAVQYRRAHPPKLPAPPQSHRLYNTWHVAEVALSPNGTHAVVVYDSGIGLLWNMAKRQRVELPFRIDARAYELTRRDPVFSADGSLLAIATRDGREVLWDTGAGKERMVLTKAVTYYHTMAFSPDGRRLAMVSDEEIRVVDVVTGKSVTVPRAPLPLLDWELSAFTNDSTRLVLSNGDGDVQVVRSDTGQILRTFSAFPRLPYRIMAAGNDIVTIGADRPPERVNLATGKRTTLPKECEPPTWDSIAFSPDGTRMVSVEGFEHWDQRAIALVVRRTDTCQRVGDRKPIGLWFPASFNAWPGVASMVWTRDGKHLAVATSTAISLWPAP